MVPSPTPNENGGAAAQDALKPKCGPSPPPRLPPVPQLRPPPPPVVDPPPARRLPRQVQPQPPRLRDRPHPPQQLRRLAGRARRGRILGRVDRLLPERRVH